MLIIGFTGSQYGMNEAQLAALRRELPRPDPVDEFHHGDCVGADEAAARLADEYGYYVVCHPPTDDRKRAFFRARRGQVLEPLTYMARNEKIVHYAQRLIATPRRPESADPRSGTWATIRRAFRKGIHVTIIMPDGNCTRVSG